MNRQLTAASIGLDVSGNAQSQSRRIADPRSFKIVAAADNLVASASLDMKLTAVLEATPPRCLQNPIHFDCRVCYLLFGRSGYLMYLVIGIP